MKRSFALLFAIIALALLAGRALLSVQSVARVATKPQPIATPVPKTVALPTTPAPLPSYESYLQIVVTADGFAPVMNLPKPDPNSHWKNPAKPVEPAFPKNFDAPVRVRSGVADVQATPLNANPDSRGEIGADGSLIYKDAFEGCDVQYRCTALKTEEFIVVRAQREEEGRHSCATAGLPSSAPAEGRDVATDSPRGDARPSETTGYNPAPIQRPSEIERALCRRTAGQASSGTPSESQSAIRNLKSAMQFSWNLDTHGLTARLTPAHTIELCDNAGVPRLRINAPGLRAGRRDRNESGARENPH